MLQLKRPDKSFSATWPKLDRRLGDYIRWGKTKAPHVAFLTVNFKFPSSCGLCLSGAVAAYFQECGPWRKVLDIRSEDYAEVIQECVMANAEA